MGVAQRGNGAFTVGGYTADGMGVAFVGGTMSTSRVTNTPGSTDARYALSVATGTQSLASHYTELFMRAEDVTRLAGKSATLSFVAKASAGTPKIGVEIEQSFGTGGTPSAIVYTAVSAVTISATFTRYTVSFTVPSISGKTLGTAGNDYLSVNLFLSAGSDFAARASSIGIQNTTIDITDVQLEHGGATAFERLPKHEQLAWCQRYYVKVGIGSSPEQIAVGLVANASVGRTILPLPVEMRATPTVTPNGNAYNARYGPDTVTAVNSLASFGPTTKAVGITVTMSAGVFGTVGQAMLLECGGSTLGIDISAEL